MKELCTMVVICLAAWLLFFGEAFACAVKHLAVAKIKGMLSFERDWDDHIAIWPTFLAALVLIFLATALYVAVF